MTGFRQLHCKMWSSDTWFSGLTTEMKLLFIYLFSNEHTSVCGLYELPIRVMSFESGLERTQVESILNFFIDADKIAYDFEKGVIWVKNMWRYQGSSSPKLAARIKADIKAVPDCDLKKYVVKVLSDTVSIPYSNSSDTAISVSVSVSDINKDSLDSFTSSETAQAIEAFNSNGHARKCESLYQQVTGQSCIPASAMSSAMHNIQAILDYCQGDLARAVEISKPVFQRWCSTQGKTGRTYSKLNAAWLEKVLENLAPAVEPEDPEKARVERVRLELERLSQL